MLFKGTALTRGSGIGVVTATGLATELGRVSRLVEEAEPGSSPLEKKLARLSTQLVWATLILTALIAGVGLTTGKDAVPHDRGGDCARRSRRSRKACRSWRRSRSRAACGAWRGRTR